MASKHLIEKMFPRLSAGFIVYLGTLLLLSEYSNVPVWLLITAHVYVIFCLSVRLPASPAACCAGQETVGLCQKERAEAFRPG